MNSNFLYGLKLPLGRWELRVPLVVLLAFFISCAVGIIVKIFLSYDQAALIVDCAHLLIHMFVGLQTSHMVMYRKDRILQLSSALEDFGVYRGREAEARVIKEDIERVLQRMYGLFSTTMISAITCFILLPIFNLFTESGRSDLSKILVWPMWMWVPENVWWGVSILFLIEAITAMSLLFLVLNLTFYLASLGSMIVGHCKSLCLMLRSMEERATSAEVVGPISYELALNFETDLCARRLNLIHRLAEVTADIFAPYLSILYYAGMLTICLSGIQVIKANQDLQQTLKFLGIFSSELLVMTLATYISEAVIDGFSGVQSTLYDLPWYKYPKLTAKRIQLMTTTCTFTGLRTFLGYELTLFHLADVLNASYKYYSLLLITMK